MADIIKPGRKQAGWSEKFKCTGSGNGDGGCGAVLLISEYDLYETVNSYQGHEEYRATFCCPQCGVETNVPWRKVLSKGRFGGKRPTDQERKSIAMKNLGRRQ